MRKRQRGGWTGIRCGHQKSKSDSPVRVPAAQQPGQRVPGVRLRVRLQEVVLAAVAGELQFGADLLCDVCVFFFWREGVVERGGGDELAAGNAGPRERKEKRRALRTTPRARTLPHALARSLSVLCNAPSKKVFSKTHPVPRARRPGGCDGRRDAGRVAVKVQGPLVQGARGEHGDAVVCGGRWAGGRHGVGVVWDGPPARLSEGRQKKKEEKKLGAAAARHTEKKNEDAPTNKSNGAR
jgi:hypothetical protein